MTHFDLFPKNDQGPAPLISLTDFYTHNASLQKEGKPIDPHNFRKPPVCEDRRLSFEELGLSETIEEADGAVDGIESLLYRLEA